MIARVIVDISNSEVDKIFDYEIPSNLNVCKGSRVLVPFGTKRIEGFCIDIVENSDVPTLKNVEGVLDEFVCISQEMLELMKYMKQKTGKKQVILQRKVITTIHTKIVTYVVI